MNRELIELQAAKLREGWGFSHTEPINVEQLLLKLNILTLFRPMSESFSGMCLKRGNFCFILVNCKHPVGRQNFTIAHELYHLFGEEDLYRHCSTSDSAAQSKEEKKANYFASALLMPKLGLQKMIPEDELKSKALSIGTLLTLENYFNVSRSALLVRLDQLRIISKKKYEKLSLLPVSELAKEYGFNTTLYKSGNCGKIIGDYGIKARKLFDEELISEGHFIELMYKIGVKPNLNNVTKVSDVWTGV
jgi:Zn-dependent peptidase ImmA (M78 family)